MTLADLPTDSGEGVIVLTYQWQVCDEDVCVDIPGATADALPRWVPWEPGQTFRCVVSVSEEGPGAPLSPGPDAAASQRGIRSRGEPS